MHDRLFTADFAPTPYWWAQVPPAQASRPAPPARVEVAVIGAGYTGLHAALVTARGGRDTVVLDAADAGFGCSSRNGGQVSTSVKPEIDALASRHGRERALAIHREGHRALAWLGEFIGAEAIDCDFHISGRFHAAHNRAAYERLARSVAQPVAPDLASDGHVVARTEQHTVLGTDAYHGGVIYPRHALLHPARYHRGLLERVRAAGAAVVPHCAVTAVVRERDGFRLQTAGGVIHARDVVVATNGYTGSVTPWLRRRVIPIGSYLIATEPLAPGLMDRLMPTSRAVSDTRRVVYYYRASPDRTRMVFGGRVSLAETDPRISGPRLHQEMVRIFPELAGVAISHSWVGFVAYTFDTVAHSGVHDGMHYAMGYCGSGVSMASWLGMRSGQRLLGDADAGTAFDDLPFPTRPLYDGRPWFLAGSVAWFRWLDRLPL